jgi:hypothetical protein
MISASTRNGYRAEEDVDVLADKLFSIKIRKSLSPSILSLQWKP